jgi:hypothetical protein
MESVAFKEGAQKAHQYGPLFRCETVSLGKKQLIPESQVFAGFCFT